MERSRYRYLFLEIARDALPCFQKQFLSDTVLLASSDLMFPRYVFIRFYFGGYFFNVLERESVWILTLVTHFSLQI